MPSRDEDLRTVRACVRHGETVPAKVAARLEALGIDVNALISRLIQNMEFAR